MQIKLLNQSFPGSMHTQHLYLVIIMSAGALLKIFVTVTHLELFFADQDSLF